jgi:deoxyribonuclease-4
MMRIGFHVQTAGGWGKTLERAVARRCTTVQIFTSAPVQWAHKALTPEEAAAFGAALRELDVHPLFVHAIYLLNVATSDRELWAKSRDNLATELERAAWFGAEGVVMHLGSVGAEGSQAEGVRNVARAVDEALGRAPEGPRVLLENCAGQGNLVGCTPASLGEVIGRSRYPERLGVCIDTAHALAAGYAVNTEDGLGTLLAECQEAFGLERLRLIHANDSKTPLGSNADRHWHIGKGFIGHAGFRVIANHPALRGLPFIMETPDPEEWGERDLLALRRAVESEYRPALPRKG